MSEAILAKWFADEKNFGDLLTPYLIKKMTGVSPVNVLNSFRGRNILHYDLMSARDRWTLTQRMRLTRKQEYSCIGSILGWSDWRPDIQVVWGSGYMSDAFKLRHRPRQIIAVRGERTLNLLDRDLQKDVVALGDPGILISEFVDVSDVVASEKIGLIAHFSQKSHPLVTQLAADSRFELIDIQSDVEPFMRALSSCSRVVSSAMHGLIAADSMAIPNRWINFGPLLSGGTFKFQDYFSISGGEQKEPDQIESVTDILEAADRATARDLTNMKLSLLASSPFTISGMQ